MRNAVLPVLMIAAAMIIASCTPKDIADTSAAVRRIPVKANADPLQIANAGHGMVFDAAMREIRFDDQSLLAKQAALLGAVEARATKDSRHIAIKAEYDKVVASGDVSPADRMLLNAAVIAAIASKIEGNEALKYRLQNELLLRHIRWLRPLRISDRISELIRKWWPDLVRPAPDTGYMARCRAAGVPIPPDWAQTGTAWVDQGALGRNLLRNGEYAGVFTYHDPAVRGACVALPRAPVNGSTAAGIICQSAMTGAACFWDNKLRSDGVAASPVDWRGGTILRIAELQDGDMLSENCTGCHTGNNVYLVSPDDPTWAKLLRRAMTGVDHGNFTLRVRASTDNSGSAASGGTARYVPISSQPAWRNTQNGPTCNGSCHELPSYPGALPMPPACASGGVAACYIDPF